MSIKSDIAYVEKAISAYRGMDLDEDEEYSLDDLEACFRAEPEETSAWFCHTYGTDELPSLELGSYYAGCEFWTAYGSWEEAAREADSYAGPYDEKYGDDIDSFIVEVDRYRDGWFIRNGKLYIRSIP